MAEELKVPCCKEEHTTKYCPHCGRRLQRDLWELVEFCRVMSGEGGEVKLDDVKFCQEAFKSLGDQLAQLLRERMTGKTRKVVPRQSQGTQLPLVKTQSGERDRRIVEFFQSTNNEFATAREIAGSVELSRASVYETLHRKMDTLYERRKSELGKIRVEWRLRTSTVVEGKGNGGEDHSEVVRGSASVTERVPATA